MKNPQIIGSGIGAVLAAVLIYHTWQWILGGLALFGAAYLCNQVNDNRRR